MTIKKKTIKKSPKKSLAKKSKVIPKNKPIKSKVKKVIAKRAKKAEKLPSFMTNTAALKHYRFALKYIELELNATQAYLTVYGEAYELDKGKTMSNAYAASAASRLLTNAKVQGHVKELIAELLEEDRSNAKTIIARYSRWADADITDYIDIDIITKKDMTGKEYTEAVPNMVKLRSLPVEMRRNIKSLTFKDGAVKFELVDKKGSNDQLAKLAGLDKGEKNEERQIHIHFDKLDEQL